MWKPIKNYEGIYEVSNFGGIQSVERFIVDRIGRKRRLSEKLLKPITTEGYLVVSLYKIDKGKRLYVHVLVAQAFIPNPDGKPFVNHIDRNRGNPKAENLEWVTQSENIKHAHSKTIIEKDEKEKKFTEIPVDEKEIWKEIKVYEDYEISNFGRCRRVKGVIRDSKGRERKVPERILKPRKTSSNKCQIELRKDKKSKFKFLHRIVAETFLLNPENKLFVVHIDGNTDNNSVFNLEWETSSEISKLKSDSQEKYGGGKAPK